MSDRDGFFQLILLGVGVFVVFTLIANLDNFGLSTTPGLWESVNTLIAPLIIVICFLGFAAFVVTHR